MSATKAKKHKMTICFPDICSVCGLPHDVVVSILSKRQILWLCGHCIAALHVKATQRGYDFSAVRYRHTSDVAGGVQ